MSRVAIVGASRDRKKYGNKAVRAFVKGGWTVYPVSASEDEIEGIPAYKRLTDIPGSIDRVSLYLPPQKGMELVDDMAAVAPKEVFLNPGSESENLLRALAAKGLNAIQACSVVNIGLRPDMFPDE